MISNSISKTPTVYNHATAIIIFLFCDKFSFYSPKQLKNIYSEVVVSKAKNSIKTKGKSVVWSRPASHCCDATKHSACVTFIFLLGEGGEAGVTSRWRERGGVIDPPRLRVTRLLVSSLLAVSCLLAAGFKNRV